MILSAAPDNAGTAEQRDPPAHRRRRHLPRPRRTHPPRRRRARRQSDEWTEGRRYIGLDLLAKSRIRIVATEPATRASEPAATTEPLTAYSKVPARSRGGILYSSADVTAGDVRGGGVDRRTRAVLHGNFAVPWSCGHSRCLPGARTP
jgi:hypothetical protein